MSMSTIHWQCQRCGEINPAGRALCQSCDEPAIGNRIYEYDKKRIINLLFPQAIGRLEYFVRHVILVIIVFLVCVLTVITNNNTQMHLNDDDLIIAYGILVVSVFLFEIPYLVIPRLRSIGWSPWCSVLILIPGINILLALLLLFKRGEY